MGVLSSIFGERPAAPQTGGFTVGAEIPKELAPFYKDILGKSQALYNESVARGYEPYTGPSLAEFTPEQQQAFTGIAGLQGQQAPIYQEAMGMTRDAAAPITTEQIEEYMNPYQQAVVDIEKREAQKQYESQVVPQLAAKAAMAQPFGGSRQAILEGMAADTQQRLLGDIQAKGSAQAYQDAVNLLQNQRDRLGSGAGQLATLGANQFKSQLGEIGALQTVGEEKQQLAQQALNEAYGQYIKEQEFPFQQLGRYQSVVTGAPIQQTQYVPPTPPGPSVGQQLLGGAATMLGTYGAFGGKMPQLFNQAPAKTGGGIADLPVIKAQSGTGKYTLSELMRRMRNPNVIQPEYDERAYGVPYQTSADLENRNPYKRILWSLNSQKNPNAIRMGSDSYGPLKALMPRDAKEIAELSDVYSAQNTANIASNIKDNFDPAAVVDLQNVYEMPENLSSGLTVSAEDILANQGLEGGAINIKEKKPLTLEEYKAKKIKEREEGQGIFGKSRFNFGKGFYNSQFLKDVGNLNIKDKVFGGLESLIAATEIGKQKIVKPAVDKLSQASQYFGQGEFSVNPEYPEVPNQIFKKEIIEKRMEEIKEDAKTSFDNFFDKSVLPSKDKIKSIMNKTDSTIAVENLYRDLSTKGGDVKNDAIMKIEKLKTKFDNEKDIDKNLTKSNNIIEKNNEIINNNDSSVNQSIDNAGKNLVEAGNKVATLQDIVNNNPDKSDSDLDKAQDKYLDALKLYNTNLNNKDKLINQSQTESFWAFVARVGANISKGAGISESVAAELPQAMKDRKSLIQAKSNLEDKKQLGLVNLAKAEMDIETKNAAAEATALNNKLERLNKLNVAMVGKTPKDRYFKGSYEDSQDIIKAGFDYFGDFVKGQKQDYKNSLAQRTKITGLNANNFDDAWSAFLNEVKPEIIFSKMKNDPNTDNLSPSQLVSKHLLETWTNTRGSFTDKKGWSFKQILPGDSRVDFNIN